jgi:hypothetical protein
MYTKVIRNQFEIKEGAIIHTPTGAEFTPVIGTADSILIWTGEIGRRLQTGERYRYADVFAVMKMIGNKVCRRRPSCYAPSTR